MSKILKGPPLEPSFCQGINKPLGDYILEYIRTTEDRIYMIQGKTKESIRLSQLVEQSLNLAAQLQALGSKPGTFVAIISENRIEFMIIYLAVILTGATLTCYNNFCTIDELMHIANLTTPSILFYTKDNEEKIVKLKDIINIKYLIGIDVSLNGVLQYPDLVKKIDLKLKEIKIDANDTVVVLFSSGTTGFPKGVMLTHRNIVCMLEIIKKKNIFACEGNFSISALPMYHAFGMFINLYTIMLDHTLIFLRKFEEKLYLSLIEQYKIKFFSVVPPLMVLFIKSDNIKNYDISSVKHIICGGAAIKLEVEHEIIKKLNLTRVQQCYGMTEITFACTYKPKGNTKEATVGSLIPGIDAKVIDTNSDKTLGVNEVGELCFRGPTVMKGYIKNPAETFQTIRSGWLHTGDIGYYDEDGDFFIVDRKKELIKYKGFQVAPAELEALLIKYPDVKDAGVIGIPDEFSGELPKAFVVKRKGSQITSKELENYISSKVSPHKWLRGGITFIDEIPKSPSGKILRRELKKRVDLVSKY